MAYAPTALQAAQDLHQMQLLPHERLQLQSQLAAAGERDLQTEQCTVKRLMAETDALERAEVVRGAISHEIVS